MQSLQKHHKCTKRYACKLPAVGLVLDRVASPECTKYCACVSKIAQGTVNAQFAKTPKMRIGETAQWDPMKCDPKWTKRNACA